MRLSDVPALPPELLAQIRQLHFSTRRLAEAGVGGQYRSAFRGHGIEFEEVREYIAGDDIGSIDWKVTARSKKPYVKSYREERELTVMIAVDVSASTKTATRGKLRETFLAQVGAVLTFMALKNNDNVGLVTFSDRIETYHPPKKGRYAVWRILHEVLTPGRAHPRTDLGTAFAFLSRVLHRSSVIFVLSDFIAGGFEKDLALLARRHDVTAILVNDPADAQVPNISFVVFTDPESGEQTIVDTKSKLFKNNYLHQAQVQRKKITNTFSQNGVGLIELGTDRDFMYALKKYFHRRSRPHVMNRGRTQELGQK